MKHKKILLLLAAILTSMCAATTETSAAHKRGVIDTSKSPYAKLRSIPMQDTHLTHGFWRKRFELCADHMIPAMKKAMLGRGIRQAEPHQVHGRLNRRESRGYALG